MRTIAVLGMRTVIPYFLAWPAIPGAGLTMVLNSQGHKTHIVAYGKKFGQKK
jgi:hypothetical protein